MNKPRRIWIYGLSIVLIGIFMVKDAFFQPGIKDLDGEFSEMAFVRNEQNKGGVVRIYAMAVGDTANANYMACGEMLPHNEYGSKTVAYFFDKDKPIPQKLLLDSPHFDHGHFHPLSMYVKDEKGEAAITYLP